MEERIRRITSHKSKRQREHYGIPLEADKDRHRKMFNFRSIGDILYRIVYIAGSLIGIVVVGAVAIIVWISDWIFGENK